VKGAATPLPKREQSKA